MKASGLELVAVTKRYGDTVAVDAIDLKVPGVAIIAACSGRPAAARAPPCA